VGLLAGPASPAGGSQLGSRGILQSLGSGALTDLLDNLGDFFGGDPARAAGIDRGCLDGRVRLSLGRLLRLAYFFGRLALRRLGGRPRLDFGLISNALRVLGSQTRFFLGSHDRIFLMVRHRSGGSRRSHPRCRRRNVVIPSEEFAACGAEIPAGLI
jgi:hypothetical protein